MHYKWKVAKGHINRVTSSDIYWPREKAKLLFVFFVLLFQKEEKVDNKLSSGKVTFKSP
jgi:hypothetical protein